MASPSPHGQYISLPTDLHAHMTVHDGDLVEVTSQTPQYGSLPKSDADSIISGVGFPGSTFWTHWKSL